MQADKQYYNVSGRLAQGSVFEPQTTDMKGRPLTDRNGNPKVQYFIGVAVAKTATDFAAAWAAIGAAAAAAFPGGQSQQAGFSWKVIDGDDPAHAGKVGFAGHYIFRFTSGYPWQAVAQGATRPIANPEEIKRGYYVRVFFTIAGNGDVSVGGKPGVYLNGSVVELLGVGEIITSGPDASGIIGAAGVAPVIAGMQATPVAPVAVAPVAPMAPLAAPLVPAPVAVAPVAVAPLAVAPVAPVAVAPLAVAPVAPAAVAPLAVAPVAPAAVTPLAPLAPMAPVSVIAPNPAILNPTTGLPQ